jgi:hypothetical protein
MQTLSDRGAKARIWIAFLFLFFIMSVLSVGAYFIADLSRLQDRVVALESQTALQGITDPQQLDEAIKRHPSNKLLRMIAMAIKTENETSAAIERLSNEAEPAALQKAANLPGASSSDLEALRRDLKTAEANARTLPPRYADFMRAQHDELQRYALSLHADKDTVGKFLDEIDKRHAKTAALDSNIASARADYYRAYESYVAVLAREFGAYKVIKGELVFPFQLTVNRYNAATQAMTLAAKRVAELEEERGKLTERQLEDWREQFLSSK